MPGYRWPPACAVAGSPHGVEAGERPDAGSQAAWRSSARFFA